MENKNICSFCGTENEEEYKYCKNCGSEIVPAANEEKETENVKTEEFVPPQNTAENSDFNSNNATYTTASSGSNYKRFPNGIIADSISGVSSDEMALFIGKKAYTILPKFSKMELTGSKVSWTWPVAVLGYLFGPLGAAFWFFYRKMYKPAVILSLIGAVLTVITTIMTGSVDINIEVITEAIINGDVEGYTSALESISAEDTVFSVIAALIENVSSIATCVICGLFGLNIYKNHCAEKIISYRAVQADSRYYKLGLTAIGGVSGGMATLGVVIMLTVTNLASIISTLIGICF